MFEKIFSTPHENLFLKLTFRADGVAIAEKIVAYGKQLIKEEA